jgi:hypothetical protein
LHVPNFHTKRQEERNCFGNKGKITKKENNEGRTEGIKKQGRKKGKPWQIKRGSTK